MSYRELNLLPPERRKILARLLVVNAFNGFLKNLIWGLSLTSIVAIIAIIILRIWIAALPIETSTLLAEQVGRYKELRNQISVQNDNLKIMRELSEDKVTWSVLFPDVFSALTPGTHIQQLSGDAAVPRLSLSGQAVARSALVVIQDRLTQLEWISNVKAPNSNLLERTNPSYSFDIFIKQNMEDKDKEVKK